MEHSAFDPTWSKLGTKQRITKGLKGKIWTPPADMNDWCDELSRRLPCLGASENELGKRGVADWDQKGLGQHSSSAHEVIGLMQQAKERLDKLISRPERLASRLHRRLFGWTGRIHSLGPSCQSVCY
ncbi:hypothetical protein GB937_005427 [Aspergillus fischeri]|nr:hypothetical protein GB937_005427 [Aspergillus fischeri]